MPFAFEEEFSADHIRFWNLYWSVLMRIRKQRALHSMLPIDEAEQEQFYKQQDCWIGAKEYAILLILGRGLAKSSSLEAAAVMRGCILGGYALYICEAQDQAEEHIGNCKGVIVDDDSRLVEFYPHMAVDENATFRGKKTKNRTDLFITVGGWICRAKGLNAALRGIRVGNLRPDGIYIDDIDNVNDSIAVSIKKLKQLTTSVIPTQARRHATILVGQNLIGETTVVNQIYTGQSDALAERTVIGVSNTFEEFRLNHEYVTVLDDVDGRIKHRILPAARPTWAGVRISDAQKFLNDSGLEPFLAEYMNSFEHQKMGKVFEFDEARHVITWDQFEQIFGVRHIPGNWRIKASADLGYTKDSISAWQFTARSARNSKLPGLYFAYRSCTFEMQSIDDQAIALWEQMFPDPETGRKHFEATQRFTNYPDLFRLLDTKPRCSRAMHQFEYNRVKDQYDLKKIDPLTWKDIPAEDKSLFYVERADKTFESQIQSWAISHEATGAQLTLAQRYGIPARKVARFEKDAGVDEANHLLRGDYTRPHPFYDDELVPETDLYKLGCPYLFFVVRRIKAPEDDRDMKILRDHVANQRWTQEKLTDQGLTRSIPMKYRSDAADALRHFALDYALPESTPLTIPEEVESRIADEYKPKKGMTVEEQMRVEAARAAAEEKTAIELGLIDKEEYESWQ